MYTAANIVLVVNIQNFLFSTPTPPTVHSKIYYYNEDIHINGVVFKQESLKF